jgi:hypothetical protein
LAEEEIKSYSESNFADVFEEYSDTEINELKVDVYNRNYIRKQLHNTKSGQIVRRVTS